jgi:hypothetical protein
MRPHWSTAFVDREQGRFAAQKVADHIADLAGGADRMSIYNARHPRQGVQLPSTHIVYKHTSIRDLDVIRRCLLEKPSTTLNLRQHLGPPRSRFPVARLDNPVRAIVVDIYDTGNRRVLLGYSRNGEPLFDRETAALDRCAA